MTYFVISLNIHLNIIVFKKLNLKCFFKTLKRFKEYFKNKAMV